MFLFAARRHPAGSAAYRPNENAALSPQRGRERQRLASDRHPFSAVCAETAVFRTPILNKRAPFRERLVGVGSVSVDIILVLLRIERTLFTRLSGQKNQRVAGDLGSTSWGTFWKQEIGAY